MNQDTQIKLAKADGWTNVKQPDSHPFLTAGKPPKDHKHYKFPIHTIPDYSDFNELFRLIAKVVAKTEGYSIRIEIANYPDEGFATVVFSNYDGLVESWDSKTLEELREHVAEAILKAGK